MYAELTGDSKKQRIKSHCDNKRYVNEGHWTVNNKSFVPPTHFFDNAYRITERILEADLQKKFDDSIRKGFS